MLSESTWSEVLSDSQRQHLRQFLPKFPDNNFAEQDETIGDLFNNTNFHFGNPLHLAQKQFRGAYLDTNSPTNKQQYHAEYICDALFLNMILMILSQMVTSILKWSSTDNCVPSPRRSDSYTPFSSITTNCWSTSSSPERYFYKSLKYKAHGVSQSV